MTKLEKYLSEYNESHLNPTNILIHKVCVPLILFSIIGLIYCIPLSYSGIPLVVIPSVLALSYYFSLSRKYAFIMVLVFAVMLFLNHLILQTGYLLYISIAIFIVSWIFQFIGHKIEGKKPSFVKDLQFLLIGPLWTLKNTFSMK